MSRVEPRSTISVPLEPQPSPGVPETPAEPGQPVDRYEPAGGEAAGDHRAAPPELPLDRRIHPTQSAPGYARDYRDFLEGRRDAIKSARTLEELRDIAIEAPSDVLAKVGMESLDALHARLDHEHRKVLLAKVDRGYELIGSTPPGTLIAIFKLKAEAKGTFVEGDVSVDTQGKTELAEKFGVGLSVPVGPVNTSVSAVTSVDGKGQVTHGVREKLKMKSGDASVTLTTTAGKADLEVEGAVGKIKVSSNHDVEIHAGAKQARLTAVYQPSQARFGLGASTRLELGDASVDVQVRGMIQGMRDDDVRRALEGWLAAPPQPAR